MIYMFLLILDGKRKFSTGETHGFISLENWVMVYFLNAIDNNFLIDILI
jgi:hypothetical protein